MALSDDEVERVPTEVSAAATAKADEAKPINAESMVAQQERRAAILRRAGIEPGRGRTLSPKEAAIREMAEREHRMREFAKWLNEPTTD